MSDTEKQMPATSVWRGVVLVALATASFGAVSFMFFSMPSQPERDLKIVSDKTLEITRPAAPQAGYVGSASCRECHLQVYDEYQQHPMAQSLFPVLDAPIVENYDEASFKTPARRRYSISKTAEGVFHHEVGLDQEEQAVYEQTVNVRYAMGSGRRGRSYVLNRDGWLYMSPIAWYSEGKRWDLAPGYVPGNHLRFSRQALDRCLQCHAGRMAYLENAASQGLNYHQYDAQPFVEHSIGCERCHGPGEAHIDHRQAGKLDAGDPIVNPEKLDGPKREAVCNQCHLLGEYQILRYGRRHGDFRPGQNIGDTWTVFIAAEERGGTRAVSHMEQLQQSRCFQQSGGRLACISCHDAHSVPAAQEKTQVYRDQCLQCHKEQGCALPLEAQRKLPADGSCIACHMPRFSASDIPHTTQTDHRIQRVSPTLPPDSDEPSPHPALKIFDVAAVPLTELERNRAQGLILAKRAEEFKSVELAKQAERLLRPFIEAANDDLLTLDALAACCWIQGRVSEAADYWERALGRAPRDLRPIRSLMLASRTLGNDAVAAEYAERYLANNPWSASVHNEFAELLAKRGEVRLAIERAEHARTLDPSDMAIYGRLLALYQQTGDSHQVQQLIQSIQQLGGEIREAQPLSR
ncbi:MAG: hypothetical protein CMJ64_20980 [Planctomycetaceae bacterium]|nr:hypothetical protein [Planctomycetaceae bacterium]